jgi:hypothetical protein
MEITTVVSGGAVRRVRTRLLSVLLAFALMAGTLLLIQQRADAAPARPAAAATAQFGELFSSVVCPILLAVRNAFSGGIFGDFVTPLLNQFLVAFGCAPSG